MLDKEFKQKIRQLLHEVNEFLGETEIFIEESDVLLTEGIRHRTQNLIKKLDNFKNGGSQNTQ